MGDLTRRASTPEAHPPRPGARSSRRRWRPRETRGGGETPARDVPGEIGFADDARDPTHSERREEKSAGGERDPGVGEEASCDLRELDVTVLPAARGGAGHQDRPARYAVPCADELPPAKRRRCVPAASLPPRWTRPGRLRFMGPPLAVPGRPEPGRPTSVPRKGSPVEGP